MSLNKVILIGNVGKDPEVRYIESNTAVATFPLATHDGGYKKSNGTEVAPRTEWHNIVAWRERAQFVERHVHKSSQLYVEGKIRSRSYESKDGIKRFVTEIYADRIEFYSSGSSRPDSQNANNNNQPTSTPAEAVTPLPSSDVPPPSEPVDDIPF
ncbi:MAG: single-stranded DNA-binding protein [Tannerella sp.]|nr:single-stranded DNA-binding protein [Tannerella sp.]